MLIPILLVIFVCCVLLWVVNASGWMPMPPPFVWGFNIVVLLVFLLIVLRLGGFNLGVL
jgi:hypothetical protein